MRKLALTLILVLSISSITFNASAGDLEPSAPPGPTMHTLNEIYDQIVQNAVPRYEYKRLSIYDNETVTIHTGSGVVHSIIYVDSSIGSLELIDGDDTICLLQWNYTGSYSPQVVPLDISYKNSLKLKCTFHVFSGTVVYKPDN